MRGALQEWLDALEHVGTDEHKESGTGAVADRDFAESYGVLLDGRRVSRD